MAGLCFLRVNATQPCEGYPGECVVNSVCSTQVGDVNMLYFYLSSIADFTGRQKLVTQIIQLFGLTISWLEMIKVKMFGKELQISHFILNLHLDDISTRE